MSDQYARAKELFLEAITRTEEERDAFLVVACEGDAELLARTRELIASDRDEDSLLDRNAAELIQPPAEEATTIVGNDAASQLGTLGRYRIVRRVGEGGMGTVYEARQDSPSRTVALKVISSALVTPELLRRFEHETQVLGRLQHPGIAQIFEADRVETENGTQPFFAMEYIRGVPITDFVERNRLGTRQRLELLAKVCDAIEHAHQRGVIHRDLKPANILVDESGQPKILDFGVARATDGDVQAATMRTDIGQLVGTLPYMSPEQASGDPDEIDIRSDVYALGVVAYELLAGRLPYDVRQQMIHEAVRVIREQDPTPLSSVNRVFRGDVETIVGKSLEKPKTRRYQSAAALASDIRRYLGDQPIEARPQSTWYQFAKFTRRNKAWAIGAVAFVLALVAGLIATGLVAREATRQRDIAREASALATREAASKAFVSDFLTNMFNVSDPSEARGNSITARELLDVGAQKLDQLDDEQTRADLAATIGGVYSGLGLFDQAERLLVQALADHRRLKGDDHPDTIKLMHMLGVVYQDKDRIAEGEALFTEAFDRAASVLGEKDRMTLIIKVSLGAMQSRRGDYAGAGATISSALETQERVLDADDPAVLSAMSLLAVNYRIQARYEESEAMFNRALTRARRVHGTDHPRTLEMMRLLGSLYRELEREEEAEAILTEAVGIQSRVLGEDHTETLATYNTLGHVYIELKRFEEAERVFASTLEASRRVRGEEHVDTTLVMVNLALAYKRLGRYEDAAALYRETLEIQQRTLGMEHADTAIALFQLANVNRTLGKYDESAKYYEQAIVVDTKALGENHPYVADDLEEYGKLRRLMGDDAKADELIARAEAIREARKAK